MVQRFGRRAAEFVGATARGVLPGEAPIPIVAPSRGRARRRWPVVAGTAVALGVGIASGVLRSSRSGSASGGSRNGQIGNPDPGSRRCRGSTGRARPKAEDLADKSRQELYELAKEAGIEGRSSMTKGQLTWALSN